MFLINLIKIFSTIDIRTVKIYTLSNFKGYLDFKDCYVKTGMRGYSIENYLQHRCGPSFQPFGQNPPSEKQKKNCFKFYFALRGE